MISRKQVLATIESYAGILFNPALVDIFRKLCLRDRFWLDWQHSHTDLVMGAWYRSEYTEPMDYFELKETFQLLICQFLFNKSRNHPLYIMTLHPRFPLSSVW